MCNVAAGGRVRHGKPRAVRALGVAVVALAFCHGRAQAQFGPVEAFLRNVTDVSFYGATGRLLPASKQLTDDALYAYGVELLFQIGQVQRAIPGAARPPAKDTAQLVWKGVEIRRSGGEADTVYTYDVKIVPPPGPPLRTIWTFEMGLGYGQVVGLALRDSTLDLRGSVRDLPAASLYATFEPTGTYGGLRAGYMKTQGLQVITGDGARVAGSAEAFLAGAAFGQALEVGAMSLFVETAYTVRYFPSLQWQTDVVPDGAPRDLRLNQWSIGAGIQVSLRQE